LAQAATTARLRPVAVNDGGALPMVVRTLAL